MEKQFWHLDWSENLSVGIPEIDREHRQFIKQINDLNQSIVDRGDLQEIRDKMQLILDNGKHHFCNEEAMLEQRNYPGAEHHAREHRAIIENFSRIMSGFSEQTMLYQWIAAGLRVKAALIGHLLGADMQYRDYLNSISP